MRLPDNIQKSGTRRGEYIAYVNGVQRIQRVGKVWQTYALGSMAGEFVPASATTLAQLSAKIELHAAALSEGRSLSPCSPETMKAKYNKRKSWEKQAVWNLDNGVQATVSFGHYGEMVCRLDDKEGYWHCSSGIHTLPDRFAFVLPWQECVVQSAQQFIIRPMFEKEY